MALYVARLTPEKNLPTLFRAFQIVHQKVPNTHLVVVGGGEELENVRKLARPFGNSVTVWGESFGNELKGLYARADVFANPSITENFCTTNMEALASGTPIVAANAGGNSEQITDGINGFLSRPNDPRDMADKIVRILQDETLREELSRGARKSGMELDTWHAAGRLESAMWQLIDEASGKTSLRAAAKEEIPSRRVTGSVATSAGR